MWRDKCQARERDAAKHAAPSSRIRPQGDTCSNYSFGAFADHHEKREDIFRNGVAEVKRRLGPSATVCVVGDTPFDINAAKAAGIPVIAVATGIYTLEQLAEHTPDICVARCTDLLPFVPTIG